MASLIYTDGSSSLKSGWCGWGLTGMIDGQRVRIAGAMKGTNQLAELYAVLVALQKVPAGGHVRIVSDSMYAINSMTSFRKKWESNGYRNYMGQVIAHVDWIKIGHSLMNTRNVEFVHVRGHTGNPGNEEADQLSRHARYMAEGTSSLEALAKKIGAAESEITLLMKDG